MLNQWQISPNPTSSRRSDGSVPVEDRSLIGELCKGVILGPAQLEGKETPKCQPLIVPNHTDAQLQAQWLWGGWWISSKITGDGWWKRAIKPRKAATHRFEMDLKNPETQI